MLLKVLTRLATAGAFLALAAAPAQAKWLEAKSPHFTVIGDMSEAKLRARSLELERYSAALRYTFGLKDISPVTVYEVHDIGDVQGLLGGRMRLGSFCVPPWIRPLGWSPQVSRIAR